MMVAGPGVIVMKIEVEGCRLRLRGSSQRSVDGLNDEC